MSTTSAVAVAKPVEHQPIASDASALISMIERAAKDPQIDIDKMERLFQMHERIEARRAEAAFNGAMARAQAELKPVARKFDNTQTRSKYADLAAISEAADPIIHKHGLGTICSEFRSEIEYHLGIRIEVIHDAGHSRSYDFNIPIDGTGLKGTTNKTATHAYASTITYGRRYAKCSVFDIATKNDTDGNQPKRVDDTATISAEQAVAIEKRLTETGGDLKKFLALGKLESLGDMLASQYASAMQMIDAAAKKRGAVQ